KPGLPARSGWAALEKATLEDGRQSSQRRREHGLAAAAVSVALIWKTESRRFGGFYNWEGSRSATWSSSAQAITFAFCPAEQRKEVKPEGYCQDTSPGVTPVDVVPVVWYFQHHKASKEHAWDCHPDLFVFCSALASRGRTHEGGGLSIHSYRTSLLLFLSRLCAQCEA
ncbi:unnamed protein product, partial [Gulo gulo]